MVAPQDSLRASRFLLGRSAPVRARARHVAIALAATGIASCALLNPPADPEPDFRGSLERLEQLQPGDIVVAPMRNQTGSDEVPLEAFRTGFAEGLVDRLYSPLDNAYVDGNWVESSFRGTPAPDGMLVVALTVWDPSRIYSTGAVAAQGEVLLFEGGSTAGTPLWGAKFSEMVDLGDGRGNPPVPSEHLMGKAARLLGRQALRELPERDPVAAHRGAQPR